MLSCNALSAKMFEISKWFRMIRTEDIPERRQREKAGGLVK